MSNWVILGVGMFVSLLMVVGLLFTVLEFRDIDHHPENHEPRAFRQRSSSERTTNSGEITGRGLPWHARS